MKRTVIALLVLFSLVLSGCNFTGLHIVTGSGKMVEESRQVSGFDSVDMSGSGELVIIQGDTEGIKIEAEDNLMPYIRTEVRGHTLYIDLNTTDMLSIQTRRSMKFTVNMKDVASLELSGSGEIISDDIKAKNLDLIITGSGNVEIENLKADSMTMDVSGSGDFYLSGSAPLQKIDISGSGHCDAIRLEGKDVKVVISGSGSAEVNSTEKLDVDITGSGSVIYTGNPKINQDITGSGSLSSK